MKILLRAIFGRNFISPSAHGRAALY